MNVHPQAAETSAAAKKKPLSRRQRILLMAAVPTVLAAVGAYFWLTGGRYVETENAYVQQAILLVAPDVSGRIVEVAVKENEVVKPGDLIFRIDPASFRIALDQADAALAKARLQVDGMKVAYAIATAKLSAAQRTLDIRKRELAREVDLADKGFSTDANVDAKRLAEQTAADNVSVASEDVKSAAAALGGNPDIAVDDYPAVRDAQATREKAELDLARTTVTASAEGVVSQVSKLNVGQYVAAGTAALSIVKTDETWIEANFKETQMTHLVAGQDADIAVDTYPGAKLHGHVEGIGVATGAEFSLIPAQNATGNWVKVVQRIPVRIKVDTAGSKPLRTGMSATVSIDTGETRLQRLW